MTVRAIGYEPILSEKGLIAYTHDRALDESCYREVTNSDIFVLIIGGRYGSESSSSKERINKSFFEKYDSITKTEYKTASDQDIPIYVLIEKSVYSEFQTYMRNKDVDTVSYAHVDSVNVFALIEHILSQPRNNPFQTFERFEEIDSWLKEQWAGLFRELLRSTSNSEKIANLSQHMNELTQTTETLKTYLEALMQETPKREVELLIQNEDRRLEELRLTEELKKNQFIKYIERESSINFQDAIEAIENSDSIENLSGRLSSMGMDIESIEFVMSLPQAIRDLNSVRSALKKQEFSIPARSDVKKKPRSASKLSNTRDQI